MVDELEPEPVGLKRARIPSDRPNVSTVTNRPHTRCRLSARFGNRASGTAPASGVNVTTVSHGKWCIYDLTATKIRMPTAPAAKASA